MAFGVLVKFSPSSCQFKWEEGREALEDAVGFEGMVEAWRGDRRAMLEKSAGEHYARLAGKLALWPSGVSGEQEIAATTAIHGILDELLLGKPRENDQAPGDFINVGGRLVDQAQFESGPGLLTFPVSLLANDPQISDTSPLGTPTSVSSMALKEISKELLASAAETPEDRLLDLGRQADEVRSAVRAGLEKRIREYIRAVSPAKATERQRSVDIINETTKRFGFALEHPDHPGQCCYFSVPVDTGNSQGQIRLLAEGLSKKPLDRSAHLSHFAYVRVIDATRSIESLAAPVSDPASSTWVADISKAKARRGHSPR